MYIFDVMMISGVMFYENNKYNDLYNFSKNETVIQDVVVMGFQPIFNHFIPLHLHVNVLPAKTYQLDIDVEEEFESHTQNFYQLCLLVAS